MCIYVYTFFLKASQRQPSLPIYVFRVNNVPHCSSRYTCNKKLTELTANRVPVNRSHGFFYRISGISSSARTNKHGMIGIDNWLQLLIGGQLANSLRAAHAGINRFAYREGKFYSERVPFRTTTHAAKPLSNPLNGFLARHEPPNMNGRSVSQCYEFPHASSSILLWNYFVARSVEIHVLRFISPLSKYCWTKLISLYSQTSVEPILIVYICG